MVNEVNNTPKYPIEESVVVQDHASFTTYRHHTGKLFSVRKQTSPAQNTPSPLTPRERSYEDQVRSMRTNDPMNGQPRKDIAE